LTLAFSLSWNSRIQLSSCEMNQLNESLSMNVFWCGACH
jgi:hypothetical protein